MNILAISKQQHFCSGFLHKLAIDRLNNQHIWKLDICYNLLGEQRGWTHRLKRYTFMKFGQHSKVSDRHLSVFVLLNYVFPKFSIAVRYEQPGATSRLKQTKKKVPLARINSLKVTNMGQLQPPLWGVERLSMHARTHRTALIGFNYMHSG